MGFWKKANPDQITEHQQPPEDECSWWGDGCPSCGQTQLIPKPAEPTQDDPSMDRLWMQNDFLNIYRDESGDVTREGLQRRARQGNLRFVERGEGNLISSMVAPDQHRPVLDLDMPHIYVPSSTPGHGHLYINNVVLNDMAHYVLISTLVELGILGPGSRVQLDTHNMSMTRPPHVKKIADV